MKKTTLFSILKLTSILLLAQNCRALENENENTSLNNKPTKRDVLESNTEFNKDDLTFRQSLLLTSRGCFMHLNSPGEEENKKQKTEELLALINDETNTIKRSLRTLATMPLVCLDYALNTPSVLLRDNNKELSEKIYISMFNKLNENILKKNYTESTQVIIGLLTYVVSGVKLIKCIKYLVSNKLGYLSSFKILGVNILKYCFLIVEYLALSFLFASTKYKKTKIAGIVSVMIITYYFSTKYITKYTNRIKLYELKKEAKRLEEEEKKNMNFKTIISKTLMGVNKEKPKKSYLTFKEKITNKMPKTMLFIQEYNKSVKLCVGIVIVGLTLTLASLRATS